MELGRCKAFIGADFEHIRRYKEFEISPQGEWVDLDIDLDKPHHEDGWTWNSGFGVSARIDPAAHVWYGATEDSYAAIDTRAAAEGNVLRINLFRSQGPKPAQHHIAWQAPMKDSFHVPERFGLLKLVNAEMILRPSQLFRFREPEPITSTCPYPRQW